MWDHRAPHDHGHPSHHARRHPSRPARPRHRRPRRPRQDDARRRDAPPVRRLPRQPGRRRPGDGLGGPRARAGHHDHGQADRHHVRRRAAEHRGHAGPRGLRRRGRAQPADGRRGAAARRRRRGSAAADPLRALEGDAAPTAGHRRDQQDRPERRATGEVVDQVYELFMDLGADEHQIEFPIVYTNARAGTATLDLARPGHGPAAAARPARRAHARRPCTCRAIRSSCSSRTSSANDYVGPDGDRAHPQRHASGWASASRVVREEPGSDRRQRGAGPDGHAHGHGHVAHDRARASSARRSRRPGPGDIVAVAGLPDVTIGDTITDPADPRPLPRLSVDEPTLRMTFGVNTSPMSGRDGQFLTSRQLRARLEREVLGNVSHRGPPDGLRRRRSRCAVAASSSWRCSSSRCAARASSSRSSRPEVLLHEVDGEVHEPYERITIDIPPEHIGTVTHLARGPPGARRADDHRRGRSRPDGGDHPDARPGRLPRPFLTETRGTGLLHQIGEGYGPWAGEVEHRTNGVLVARPGRAPRNAYALFSLQERSTLFIGSGVDVYEGMIVGRERPLGRHGRQPDEGEEAHEHPDAQPRRGAAARRRRRRRRSSRRSSSSARTSSSRSPRSVIRLRKRTLSLHDRRRERGRDEDVRRAAEREAAGG